MCAPPLPSKFYPSDWGKWAPQVQKEEQSLTVNKFEFSLVKKGIKNSYNSRRKHRAPVTSLLMRKKPKQRFKESDNDSDSSSRVALDVLIKPPKDFSGLNNPFRSPTAGTPSDGSVEYGGRSVLSADMTPNSFQRRVQTSEKSSPVSSGAPSTVTTDGN